MVPDITLDYSHLATVLFLDRYILSCLKVQDVVVDVVVDALVGVRLDKNEEVLTVVETLVRAIFGTRRTMH
jgi:hypothetical protein